MYVREFLRILLVVGSLLWLDSAAAFVASNLVLKWTSFILLSVRFFVSDLSHKKLWPQLVWILYVRPSSIKLLICYKSALGVVCHYQYSASLLLRSQTGYRDHSVRENIMSIMSMYLIALGNYSSFHKRKRYCVSTVNLEVFFSHTELSHSFTKNVSPSRNGIFFFKSLILTPWRAYQRAHFFYCPFQYTVWYEPVGDPVGCEWL